MTTKRYTRRDTLRGALAACLMMLCTLALPTSASASGGDVKIVATTPDLAALALAIGKEHVEVTALASPTEDPHYVDPRPSHVLKLNKADLLLVNGLELEVGWLPELVVQARNKKIQQGAPGYFDASTVVKLLQVPTTAIDRAQGDIHPGGNPHYTHDPRRARDIVIALSKRLAELDPAHEDDYASNAKELSTKLEEVATSYQEKFSKLSKTQRQVVTYHASTIYISDWLGLDEVMQVEPKPGIAPNPKHIAAVLKTMRTREIRLIFQESFYPKKASKKLAQLASGELVVIAGGTRIDKGETYIERVTKMADAIFEAASKSSKK